MKDTFYSIDGIAIFVTFFLWLILCVYSITLILKNRNNLSHVLNDKQKLRYLLIGSILFPIISRISFRICDDLFMNTCHGLEAYYAFERSVSQGFGVFAYLMWIIVFLIMSIIFLLGLINPKYVKFEKRLNIFLTSFLILTFSGTMALIFLATTNFAVSGHIYTDC